MRIQLLPRLVAVSSLTAWMLWLSSSCIARAQPMREVVVLPLGTPDATAAMDLAPSIEAALVDAHVPVISLHDARDRFTARSRPPQQLTEWDQEVLSREAQKAIEHVAFGRIASAQKSVRDVIRHAERALESLNRNTDTARLILDACLSLVRSSLQTGNRERALEEGMRCRHLVPDLVPSRTSQPAQVIGVLVEVDDLLARMRIGHLTVESTPESRCAVYVNGRHLGTTPFELDRAAAGVYRVQVECGESPARVHMVQLGDQPVSLLVDTELDRAVTSESRLALRYEDPQRARAHAVADAVSLGRELSAEDIVLVTVDAGRAELARVQLRQRRLVGRAALPWSGRQGVEAAAIERAIAALTEGRIEGTPSLELVESSSATKVSSAPPRPPAASASDAARLGAVDVTARDAPTEEFQASASPVRASEESRQRVPVRGRKLAIGMTSLAMGTGLFIAAGVFAAKRDNAGSELRSVEASGEPYISRVTEWQDTRLPMYLFASLGSVTLTTSAVTLLLRSSRYSFPRWASVLSTGVGLGLASWGSVQLARGGACPASELDRGACSLDLERRDQGAFLLLAATPLLAIPLTQLFRPALPSKAMSALVAPEFDPRQRALSLKAFVRWF